MTTSEWLDLMLEEIERKKRDGKEAAAEAERRGGGQDSVSPERSANEDRVA